MDRKDALTLQVGDIVILNAEIHQDYLDIGTLRYGTDYRIDRIDVNSANDPTVTDIYVAITPLDGKSPSIYCSAKLLTKKKSIN